MVKSNQLSPGTILDISGKLYRVESSVKVSVPKGTPFIKAKLKNLTTDKVSEKNFKPDQEVNAVTKSERELEFLYLEGNDYRFLDIEELEQVVVSPRVVGEAIHYLKEGISVTATLFGETVFTIELPQFLELMVVETEGGEDEDVPVSDVTKIATLETGAKVNVPPFIEAGDIVKVDTGSEEFIQRV